MLGKDDFSIFYCLCQNGFKGRFCDEKDSNVSKNEICRPEMFDSDLTPNCNIGEYCVMEGATAKCINVSPCTATTFSCPNENEICQETFYTRPSSSLSLSLSQLTSQDGDVTPEEENFKWPSVSCDCIPGWSKSGPGLGCNNDIDECLIFSANGEQVCGNFGVCHNMPGSYRCECNDGFQGDRCDEDVDECLSSPCKHGGYCINSLGRYKCHCRHGYSGLDCENACPSRTCVNDGVCNTFNNDDGTLSWRCDCPDGIFGEKCDIVTECFTNPCGSENTCYDIIIGSNKTFVGTDLTLEDELGFKCECSDGLTGDRCEYEDRCSSKPCNQGICSMDFDLPDYPMSCDCADTGYTGTFCEEDINECLDDDTLCAPGGVCQNLNGTYACDCDDTWLGDNCQVRNFCHNVNCNFGSCRNKRDGYACDCDDGYRGANCNAIDYCYQSSSDASPICQNGSKCRNGRKGPVCQCTENFIGQFCQFQNKCLNENPCGENGECLIDQAGNIHCKCSEDYQGENCSEKITCELFTCLANQICELDPSGKPFCVEVDIIEEDEEENDVAQETDMSKINSDAPVEQTEFDNLDDDPTIIQSQSELPMYGIILIAVFGVLLLVIVISILVIIRTRRRATGTYSPNKHEKQTREQNTREVWTTLKSPEPERLI